MATLDHFPTFADQLRARRQEAGLSQEALAERAGLSRRGVSDLERGLKLMPRADTVERLAHALGLAGPERASFLAVARAHHALAPKSRAGIRSAAFSSSRDNQQPPLGGREAELAMVDAHLAHAGAPLLLFHGEPGIGKSRLLAKVSTRALGGGWQVLRGGCRPRSAQEPYEPIVSALSRWIAERGSGRVRSYLQGALWLVRLLPELTGSVAAPQPQWTLGPGQERRLMFTAVGRFLENIADVSGALLVLDDLQWMGEDALDLLGALLLQERDRPLRVVGVYRETEVRPQDPLPRFLADVAREELVAQRHVGPLREAEAHELLASLLAGFDAGDASLRERIVRRSGGVPLFLVSCARGLEIGALDGSSGAGEEIPWNLRQNIRQRVVALSEPAQRLIEVAAIAGREASVTLLRGAAGQTEEELLAALEAAGHARLLVEAGGQGYRFAHDVIREVVEADMGAARRRMLHRRIAEALERAGSDRVVERLAYHYAQAGESAKAVVYREQAGDHALARYAFAEAEQVYRETLAHFEGLGQLPGAARVREKLGNLLATTARNDQALEVLQATIEQYQACGDTEGTMRSAAAAGWSYAFVGRADEGLALVRSALERVPSDTGFHRSLVISGVHAAVLCPGHSWPGAISVQCKVV